jgi:ABC-2 type transport system ATP-binding protein
MNRGRIIALATPRDLRNSMTDPIIRIETNDPPRAVDVLSHVPMVVEASMYGRLVHAVVDDLDLARQTLPLVLAQHGLRCDRIASVTPSLEDVFVALVRQQGGVVVG